MGDHHANLEVFQEVLIVLGAVSIIIPIFYRLKLSPVLGFLLIGLVLGPTAIGALVRQVPGLDWLVISDRERVGVVAEFGVVFLMFMIGLELSLERLLLMRRLVFGLGPLQTIVSAAALAGVAIMLNQSAPDAVVIGLALALSSTAVVIQVLSEENRLTTNTGRTAFAILLFQDIAVVPILFAVAIMGRPAMGGDNLGAFAVALGQAALAVVVIIAAGRLLLRPLFRSVARTTSPELFMAACLLVLLGTAVATAGAGLSMAMGGLLAGLLLAETEYRRQIEVLIEPFKGLLLGVFLISMGMTLNLNAIAAAPLLIVGLSLGLIAVKAAITYASALLFGNSQRAALQSALILGGGGEFSFVVLSAAAALGMIEGTTGEVALIIAALTMAATPLLSTLGKVLARRLDPKATVDPALYAPTDIAEGARVIIVGFGRVGQVVAGMLKEHKVEYVALDTDVDVVSEARTKGEPVYFGEATNPLMLRNVGLADAKALVVTMDSSSGAEEVVRAAREAREDLLIVSRARDAHHAGRLYARGATDAVPETVEASLLLSETLLVDIGVPMGNVLASIHERRAQFRSEIQALAPEATVRSARRRLLREHGATRKIEAAPDKHS
ncbi:cation:proton antiporter [Terricaulis sp.]|uniref:cation:proton antiporter domain-containing protein n=1 Tax=Terricaulis sp. TaxID=2768686 RepID=UPI003783B44F